MPSLYPSTKKSYIKPSRSFRTIGEGRPAISLQIQGKNFRTRTFSLCVCSISDTSLSLSPDPTETKLQICYPTSGLSIAQLQISASTLNPQSPLPSPRTQTKPPGFRPLASGSTSRPFEENMRLHYLSDFDFLDPRDSGYQQYLSRTAKTWTEHHRIVHFII